jgi:hypothetical protein
LSPESLPEGCAVKKVRGDLKNCFVTTNSDYFLIGDERLPKVVEKKSIEAAYIGLYRERSDAWVIGWSFTSIAAAKEAHTKLEESFKDERERFRFWRTEKCVVWLGRDPQVTDECFERLLILVEARVAVAKR